MVERCINRQDIEWSMPQKSSYYNENGYQKVDIGTEISKVITSALEARIMFCFVKSRKVAVSSVQKNYFCRVKAKIKD